MRTRLLTAAVVLSGVLLATSGCSASPIAQTAAVTVTADLSSPLSSLTVLNEAKDYSGLVQAALPTSGISVPDEVPAQSLPVTVMSHDLSGEVPVTVLSTDRVVAMDISGSIAATIAGLGLIDSLVARDISTTFDEASELPVITSNAHTVNSEAILALRPDLVLTDGSIGPIDVVVQLRDAGIPVVFVDTEASVDGVAELARQTSAAFGAPAAGEALGSQLTAEIDAKIAEIAEIVPSGERLRMMFLYLRGTSGVYYLFGQESGSDVLIDALGGVDVAAEIGLEGMRPMTDEAMVAANPDLILVMTGGLESVGGVSGLLEARPAVALTEAGMNQRFVEMDDGEILSFGPRTVTVLDALARAIYAPTSGS
ncbi:hemin ABC transporter substrate-binding protein [Salinibacterium sp. SWN1162]|uniref:heme/hemin ABC transporter substrate-binding protein n=1 Tax=Salinibacterium sp. SWN1162 TaxID=2792053 RepID=UPI0018CE378B|nr:ABC transporter substrate-binding protein [Salinibacterium sp. SWN1162]MBH0008659.1 ABC transporter substrate-binding protein [Salinibacterium sp. SWN1162]